MGHTVHFGRTSENSAGPPNPARRDTQTKKEGSLWKSMGSSNWNYTFTTSPTTVSTSTRRTSTPMEAPDRLVSAGMI